MDAFRLSGNRCEQSTVEREGHGFMWGNCGKNSLGDYNHRGLQS
jgi:hypothetical protein